MFDNTLSVGIDMSCTLFDGFAISANYQRLKELKRQGETNARMAIENITAGIAAEYYNFVQQNIRLKKFQIRHVAVARTYADS